MDSCASSANFNNLRSSFIFCYIKRARRSTWFEGLCLQLSYNATTSKNKLPVYSCSLLLCNTILGKSMSDRIEHGVGIMENQKISGKIFDLWYDLITKGPCLIWLLVLEKTLIRQKSLPMQFLANFISLMQLSYCIFWVNSWPKIPIMKLAQNCTSQICLESFEKLFSHKARIPCTQVFSTLIAYCCVDPGPLRLRVKRMGWQHSTLQTSILLMML